MSDSVHSPGYYSERDGVEPIVAIEVVCSGLDGRSAWLMGNVIKYVMRAGRKTSDQTQDLAKARNYAHRLVTGRWEENDG